VSCLPLSILLSSANVDHSVTGVSVARLVDYHWRFSPDNKDRTYGVGYTISLMEANLAVVTGCVLALGPLVRRVSPSILGSGVISSRSKPSGCPQHSGERVYEEYAMTSEGMGWKSSHSRVEDPFLYSSQRGIRRRGISIDMTHSEASLVDNRSSRRCSL